MKTEEMLKVIEDAIDEDTPSVKRLQRLAEVKTALENQPDIPSTRRQDDAVILAASAVTSFETRHMAVDEVGLELLRIAIIALGKAVNTLPPGGRRNRRSDR